MAAQTDAHVQGQNALQAEKAIVAWIRRNSIAVERLEAGAGFSDLQPLKQMLSGAKVVGLGEATHGTREFYQLKQRLLEFLVSEMAFTAFALEASWAACQPINDYVLHGKGDRAALLTGQGYIPWDTEEFSSLVDWLRAYNQSVPAEKRVRFYGLDLWRNERGRSALLDFLSRVAPAELAATRTLFATLAAEEEKWPLRIDADAKNTLAEALPQVQGLIDHLTENKDTLARRASPAELNRCLRYALVMKQWIVANALTVESRSAFMAENVMHLADQEAPGTRFVVSAHNAHIRTGKQGNFGSRLRARYGQAYVALGFEFDHGSFLSRTAPSRTVLGDLRAITLPAAPAGSLPWHLAQAGAGASILDLRAAAGEPVVERWLHDPQMVHNVSWVCPDGCPFSLDMSIAQEYDGIVFVDATTPTRPTPNALRTAADRSGHLSF